MKKSRLLIVLAGLAVVASGCGYSTGGEDSTVTVIEATPTPTPEWSFLNLAALPVRTNLPESSVGVRPA